MARRAAPTLLPSHRALGHHPTGGAYAGTVTTDGGPTGPRVYAHRGMSALAPENTLAAFALCAEHGVRWFELDVDVLADGTVVVVHDTTLDRTTDRGGAYHGLSAADLAGIDCGSWFSAAFAGEPLPTLPQVVALMNESGLNANVELKSTDRRRAGALVAAVARDLEALDPALIARIDGICGGETGGRQGPSVIRDARSGAVLRG